MKSPEKKPRRIRTGVTGLDDVLGEGLPSDRLYLVQGHPGTGKTTMSLQFLLEGVRRGEKVLFITLSETRDELLTVAESHGWSLDGVEIFELSASHQSRPAEQNTLFHPSEVELNEVTEVMLAQVERVQPTRVVLDSLSELRLLSQSALRFRRQILALKQQFAGRRCTVMFLDDRLGALADAQAHTVAHGVIEMEQLAPEYGAERRRLRIVKLRGVKFRGGWHDYIIAHGGLQVFPRLIAAEHRPEFHITTASSGIQELDELLGGGMDRGTSMLVLGPAGSGKSSIAAQFAAEAIARDEPAAMFLFDENTETLMTRAAGIAMDLRTPYEQKKLWIRQIDPAEMPPGEFVSLVRQSVEQHGARVVVIDSLNGYINSMPEERFLTVHMHELLTYLAQQGVLTIVTMAQHGIMGRMESPADVSYLSDAVLLLRYFEAQGEIRQALSVMKKRTGRHERTIRELQITSAGVRVGRPLHEFHGVLSGIPTYTGAPAGMMRQDDGRRA